MLRSVVRIAAALALLPIGAAMAEPVTLKLAFFSSDRSVSYLAAAKPFVDAVNADASGLVKIDVQAGGVLGRDLTQQLRLIRDGIADITFVVPGVTPSEFPDNAIVEMPGLYRDIREATMVFTHLTAANALKGYEDFIVIGAYVTEPETFHCRTPVASLNDLKGKTIRANNSGEIAVLAKLGAVAVLMQVQQISENLSSGKLDCALVPPSPLNDYGIKRVATYHYFLGSSGAPLALLMSRKKFDALPKPAQDIIRKHSGEWSAEQFIREYSAVEQGIIAELRASPERKVTVPSEAEMTIAQSAFSAVMDEWVAKDPRNKVLRQAAEAEIRKLRAIE